MAAQVLILRRALGSAYARPAKAQLGRPPEREAARLGRPYEFEARQAAEDRLHGDRSLKACDVEPQAVVHAEAEGEVVPGVLAADVEAERVLENLRIAAGGEGRDADLTVMAAVLEAADRRPWLKHWRRALVVLMLVVTGPLLLLTALEVMRFGLGFKFMRGELDQRLPSGWTRAFLKDPSR